MSIHQVQLAESRRFYSVQIRKIIDLSGRMRRLVVGGVSLADFHTDRPGQWIKLYVPVADTAKRIGRAYTIRRFHPDVNEMEIDFVLHDHGPCVSWIKDAAIGSWFEIAGPQSSFRVAPGSDWLLLAGDETALPAIMAILESRPSVRNIYVYLEVGGDADELRAPPVDARLHWLYRSASHAAHGILLQQTLQSFQIPPGHGQIWLAGETSSVRTIRDSFLAKGITRKAIHASGYWRIGAESIREVDGDY